MKTGTHTQVPVFMTITPHDYQSCQRRRDEYQRLVRPLRREAYRQTIPCSREANQDLVIQTTLKRACHFPKIQ